MTMGPRDRAVRLEQVAARFGFSQARRVRGWQLFLDDDGHVKLRRRIFDLEELPSERLPYPHLVVISPAAVQPLVRAVGERVLDRVQKKLGLSGVELVWYHHRWLLRGKPYHQEQIDSWQDPLLRERQDWRMSRQAPLNMHTAAGESIGGRTCPYLLWAVFIMAASLPPFSDEGQMRASTPYRAGVTVVHELRHLWQAAHGFNTRKRRAEDRVDDRVDVALALRVARMRAEFNKRKCERDAEAFANTWRDKVKEIVRGVRVEEEGGRSR